MRSFDNPLRFPIPRGALEVWVMGNKFKAAKLASARHIPFAFVREGPTESGIWATLGLVPPTYAEDVARWGDETTDEVISFRPSPHTNGNPGHSNPVPGIAKWNTLSAPYSDKQIGYVVSYGGRQYRIAVGYRRRYLLAVTPGERGYQAWVREDGSEQYTRHLAGEFSSPQDAARAAEAHFLKYGALAQPA